MPTLPSLSHAPATCSATGSSRTSESFGRPTRAARHNRPPMDLELARQIWDDGNRRVEGVRQDRRRRRWLLRHRDLVIGGLRRRIGQTFTLAELADAYD